MRGRFFNHRVCTFLVAISLAGTGFGEAYGANPKESLMLRRIYEYWKDGDYVTVKKQIEDFLDKNPSTSLHDHLNAMLGDIYFQEHNYRQALATYDLIGTLEIREKTFFNQLQAHFEMKDYLPVVERGELYLKERKGLDTEESTRIRYLVAEACFRHALKTGEVEEKQSYLKMAKPHYKILTQSRFSDRVLFPLAEIHRLLREDDRAAALYLTLAQKFPENRERFLFQAAILQIKLDKKQAIQTFSKIHEMGGKRSRLAAFNRLILLYQNKNYDEFLKVYPLTIQLMPQDKVQLLQFYEGRCHYALSDYGNAIAPLEAFATEAKGRSKELKTSLLLLVNCARFLKDIPLLERTLYTFKTNFPKEVEMPQILQVHSLMCRESGNLVQAITDLKTVLTDYPSCKEIESVLYDYALLLTQTDQWIEARESFLGFLDKYPQSEKKNSAWRHLLNCCIEEMRSPTQIASDHTKETFIHLLKEALKQDQVLNLAEKRHYALVMLRCQYDLGQYEEALPVLQQYITDQTDPDVVAQAHLLYALCEHQLNGETPRFIQHAEKALALNPKLPEMCSLHVELFNAYLSKASSIEDKSEQKQFFSSAADHLFASNAWKEKAIKTENFLWMANHYFMLAKMGNGEAYEKARVLYAHLIGWDEENGTINIGNDSLYLENEVLKLAQILDQFNQTKKEVQLLEILVKKQEDSEHLLPWKMKRRAVLELAKAYEKEEQYQNAINSYQNIIRTKEAGTSSFVTDTARLQLAKMEYRMLKPQQRNAESAEIAQILHTLKDLQIQKKIASEPIHLEAALQYAEMRTHLSDKNSYVKNGIFFFTRMHDDFNSVQDPVSEEYNNLRSRYADKNGLFQAYMKYVDVQILKYQAMLAREELRKDKAVQCEEEALEILNNLLKNEEQLKPYLLDRVKRAKMEISKRI